MRAVTERTTSAKTTRSPARTRFAPWAAYAACVWALIFAALSFYWGAGGTAGEGTQSASIRDLARERDAIFIAIVWVTGVLKLLGGVLALALVRPWGRTVPDRLLLVAARSTGVGMAFYGGLGLVADSLRVAGAIESSDLTGARWHLFVWDPWWLLGGLLFLAAARRFGRHPSAAPITD